METVPDDLRQRLRQHGQEHVLTWWDRLDADQRRGLVAQLGRIDFEELRGLHAQRAVRLEKLNPARLAPLPIGGCDETQRTAYQQRGEEAFRSGQIAFLVVAGGQGTRLDFDHAKGLYPVGPITGKSLFQIHAEKVLALQRRYGNPFPLLVMTSPATDAETRRFFADRQFFGVAEAEVWFFSQGTMPALDWETGKLLMEGPGQLFLGPNGHGGTLTGLAETSLLDRLEQRGTRTVYYFQVDNPLVNLADAIFVGQHLAQDAEISTKVLPKAHAKEKVGNVLLLDSQCAIVEYIELDDELAVQTDAAGGLRFRAANPAIHLFDVAFLRKVTRDGSSMPWHLAHKKVPHLNERGERVAPTGNNALKFERFIFDVLPLAKRWTVFPTTRAKDFAPLKNKDGDDSPATVRAALIGQAADWLQAAGVDVPRGATGGPAVPLEVGPLFALDAEELGRKVDRNMRIDGPTYLG